MLEPLIEAIETVKERIEQHQQTLRENETRTRETLINPILKALGWDPAAPSLVTPEFKFGALGVDYALHGAGDKGMLFAIIEAKKLDEPLEKHRTQALNYADLANVGYAGLTNGNRWELYTFFEQGPLFEQGPIKGHRRIYISRVEISIVEDPPHECALELLVLWRPNLAPGKVDEEETRPPEDVEPTPAPPINPPLTAKWEPLSHYLAEYFGIGAPDVFKHLPSEIKFSDGSKAPIKQWYDVLVEIAKWLHSKNLLTRDQMPVRTSSGSYIANSESTKHDGNPMANPEQIAEGIYVSKYGFPGRKLDNATLLLQHCGVDPSEVHLKTADIDGGNDR